LYTNSNELIEELNVIAKHSGFVFELIKKMAKLENFEEFERLQEEYYKKYLENEDLIIRFEKKLAELKLRKIPV